MTAQARLSSCIILTCDTHDDAQPLAMFWAKRRAQLKFLGGFYAFLGGAMEPADALGAAERSLDALLRCAARELFEEAGLLFLQGQGLVCALEGSPWAQLRHTLQQGQPQALSDALTSQSLTLDTSRYRPIGRWTTPEWSALRFETEFFQVHLSPAERALVAQLPAWVDGAELEHGRWMTPQEALDAADALALITSAPTRAYLSHMARHPVAALPVLEQDEQEDPLQEHWLLKDTYTVPIKSPTLPPATHTHCYVIAGQTSFVIVDPGGMGPAELAPLWPVIDALLGLGLRFEAIVLTHHHIDHVCGVPLVQARYPQTPLWAHPRNVPLLPKLHIERLLDDGASIELGQRTLEVIFTPGHAPGHIALWDQALGACFGGDLIASQGTILIRPPEGNMRDYFASLKRVMEACPSKVLCPAHGWLILEPKAKLQEYIQHRQWREEKVLEALTAHAGPAQPAQLLAQVYGDVPSSSWPIALMSLEAHLLHLVEQGLAQREGTSYTAMA